MTLAPTYTSTAALSVTVLSVILLLCPGAWAELSSGSQVTIAATALGVLTLAAYQRAKRQGEVPWIEAGTLYLAWFWFKHGLGLIVAIAWETVPSFASSDRFHKLGVIDAIPQISYLFLLAGFGLFVGLHTPAKFAVIPTVKWKIDQAFFEANLTIYTPIAIALFYAAQSPLVPERIRFVLQAISWGVWSMVIVVSYWAFGGGGTGRQGRWLAYLTLYYLAMMGSALAIGMTGGFLYPSVMMILGFTMAKRRLPWKFLAVVLPLAFITIFPWLSAYKSTQRGGSIEDRTMSAGDTLDRMDFNSRLEATADRFILRWMDVVLPAKFTKAYPTSFEFEGGTTFILESYSLVPRLIWPEKPNVSGLLNNYSHAVGVIGEADQVTSAVMGAVSEYYINFGAVGVFVLSVLHGLYYRVLYDWLVVRGDYVIGMSIFLGLFLSDFDSFGIVNVLTSHLHLIPVTMIIMSLISRK